MSDSTNAMRGGESPTEAEVGKAIAKVVADAEQRVCVTLFFLQYGPHQIGS
jgi:ribonuclease J